MIKYEQKEIIKRPMRTNKLAFKWRVPDAKGEVGVVTHTVRNDIYASFCVVNNDIDKSSDALIRTIQRRQDIHIKINIDDYAAAKGDVSGFYRSIASKKNDIDSVNMILNDLNNFFGSECFTTTDGGETPSLQMDIFCKGILERDFAGVTTLSCPHFDESLRANAVRAEQQYIGVVSRQSEKNKFAKNRRVHKLKDITISPYESIGKNKASKVMKLTATFEDTDIKRGVLVGIRPKVYGRHKDTRNVYLKISFANASESSIANINLMVNTESAILSDVEMDNLWLNVKDKIKECFKSSLNGGYMRVLEEGGIIEHLKNEFGESSVVAEAKPKKYIPVAYVIKQFADSGYMLPYRMENDRVNEQGQELFKLADGSEVLTTGLSALANESWSEFTPERWLVRNRTGYGGIKDFIKYLLSADINGKKILNHPKSIDGYERDIAKLDLTVDGIMSDLKEQMYKNKVEFVNTGNVIQSLPIRPRVPSRYYAPTENNRINIREYLTKRGISNSVVDMAALSGTVYMGSESLSSSEQGAFFECGRFGYKAGSGQGVQLFKMDDDGDISKKFLTRGLVAGFGHELGGDSPKYYVLGEAIVDMYSFLSLVEAGGLNKEDFRVCSLNSANYTHAWFKESFGVCFPDGDDSKGSLIVGTQRTLTKDFDFHKYFNEALSFKKGSWAKEYRVDFVHDGTAESDAALGIVTRMTELAGGDRVVNVIDSKDRRYERVNDYSAVIFDKTNVSQTLSSSGITYDSNTGSFEKYDITNQLKRIESEDDRLVARARIIDKIGGGKFLLAMDNDEAGITKAIDVYNLLSFLDVPVSVVMVPFESKNSNEFSHSEVVLTVESLSGVGSEDAPLLPYGERMLLNDINDVLKKYNMLNDSSIEDAQSLIKRIVDQFEHSSSENYKKLVDGDNVSGFLKQVANGVRRTYPELVALGRELESSVSNRRVMLRSGDVGGAEVEHSNLTKLYHNIDDQIRSLPASDGLHIKNDKHLKSYLNISDAMSKKRSMKISNS